MQNKSSFFFFYNFINAIQLYLQGANKNIKIKSSFYISFLFHFDNNPLHSFNNNKTTMYLYLLLLTASLTTTVVSAQQETTNTTVSIIPTATQSMTSVETNGFNDNNINTSTQEESWLKQHNRYVFIIIIGLVVLALLIWYIVRSIRNMRRKLASENQGHMMMQETIDTNGFHKMPDYPSQQQQQQPYEHRY